MEWDYKSVGKEAWVRVPGTTRSTLAWSGSALFIGSILKPKYKDRLDDITLFPRTPHVMKIGEVFPWRVIAKFSNGVANWEKDVSGSVVLTSSDQSVISVSKNGFLHASKFGDAQLHAVHEDKFATTDIAVAAFGAGTVRDYVGGIKHPNGLTLSKHGLLITNQTSVVGCVDNKGVYKVLTKLQPKDSENISLDQIAANDKGDIFVRSIYDRSIVRVYGKNLDKLEHISLPGQQLPTDFCASGDDLYILESSGAVWKYNVTSKKLSKEFPGYASGDSLVMAKCLNYDGGKLYILDNQNNFKKINTKDGNEETIRLPAQTGNQYADFGVIGKKIILSDFHGGLVHVFDGKNMSVLSSGLVNPNGLILMDQKAIFVANFGSDFVSIINLD